MFEDVSRPRSSVSPNLPKTATAATHPSRIRSFMLAISLAYWKTVFTKFGDFLDFSKKIGGVGRVN